MSCASAGTSSVGFVWKVVGVAAKVAALCLCTSAALAVPIRFGDLYRDPSAPIVIAADGSSATLSEDPSFFSVGLSNIPVLGDPELIVAQMGSVLSFNFNFIEPLDNDDTFHFAILDGLTGESLGDGFDSYFNTSSAGLLQFDLSSLVGKTLGLQFELVAELGDTSLTSVLELSNLELTTPETPPVDVPEPSTVPLFIVSFGLLAIRSRRFSIFKVRSSRMLE